MILDERLERTAELWAHLFEGLEGCLETFTGQQSARPDARPNELELPSIGLMVVVMAAPPNGNASSLLG